MFFLGGLMRFIDVCRDLCFLSFFWFKVSIGISILFELVGEFFGLKRFLDV